MLTKVHTAAIHGIDAFPVTIETIVENGTQFNIVGMADTAVKESQLRIESAMKSSGYSFPHYRVTINLAPADIKKEGASFDLPLAIGLMTASEMVRCANIGDYMITGELSLDGSVLPVRGALPMAVKAREMGFKRLIVPEANVTEAAVVNRVEVYGVRTLGEAIEIMEGKGVHEPTRINTREIFAAEAGKSVEARRLPSILPPLGMAEALETTKIHSVAGKLQRGSKLMTRRPFRTPHHTVSPVALVGGGANPMPGEISLAHNGVLFLSPR